MNCGVFIALFSHWIVSDSLRSHGLQHAKLPCPSVSPRVCSNSYPLHQWCLPTILSSVAHFFCLQSSLASESFPVSQFFISSGQGTRASASASVLPVNIQGGFPLGLTGLISLLPKGLSGVFYSTTVHKHQFLGILPSLQSSSHKCMWPLERIALSIHNFVGRVMSLVFSTQSRFVTQGYSPKKILHQRISK